MSRISVRVEAQLRNVLCLDKRTLHADGFMQERAQAPSHKKKTAPSCPSRHQMPTMQLFLAFG